MDIFKRTKSSRPTSKKAPPTIQTKLKPNNIITKLFTPMGERRLASRVQLVLEVEDQCFVDRFGDEPA